MLNKLITIDQVMSWEPCYDREKILRLSRGKTEMTIGEIIDLRFVPAEDKLWLLLREEIIPARTLHEFAIWCAETALTRANVTDERSWNALKVKRLWLDGKATSEELSAAWSAAWDAAWEAASDAARDVASDAARYAAWDAVRAAARYAARYAAMDAVWSAAWSAARDEQLAKLKEMLRDNIKEKETNE
jgi:hypothetical protein